jgi:Peptidase family M23
MRTLSARILSAAFISFCLGISYSFASQPAGIVLNPNGISRIYPPFETNGWALTQGPYYAPNLHDHDGDDYYAQDWSVGCFSDGEKLHAGISGIAVVTYSSSYGNTLVIFDAESGFALRYGHMQEIAVDIINGSMVTAGQYVGRVGHTPGTYPQIQPSSYCASIGGRGAHLHLVLYKGVASSTSRPIVSTYFNASGTTRSATSYATNFAYAAPARLIQADSTKAIYAVDDHSVRHYVSWFVFNNQGWNFTADQNKFGGISVFDPPISAISQSTVDSMSLGETWPPRNGTLVKGDTDPTVYYIHQGIKFGIPSQDIFNCWDFKWSEVNPPVSHGGSNTVLSQGEIVSYAPGSYPPVLNWCPVYVAGGDTSPANLNPVFRATAAASALSPPLNQPVTITASFTNISEFSGANLIVDAEIYSSSGAKIWQQPVNEQSFPANESRPYQFVWVPNSVGSFLLKLAVFKGDWSANYFWLDNAYTFYVGTSTVPPGGVSPTVWWPTNAATISGSQRFKLIVPNLPLNQYQAVWQLGNDRLNPMWDIQDASNSYNDHKEAEVDVSTWLWTPTGDGRYGPYVLNFVIQDLNGRTLGKTSVSIFVSDK